MKHNIILISILVVLLNDLGISQNQTNSDSLLIVSVNKFIQDWHKNAADANDEYFEKIDGKGIYIGTDASELWTKDEFYNWSRKYFENGKAWTFNTLERNVYFSDDRNIAWFDELLDTGMGNCRASGVLVLRNNIWKIMHYHLSITIPNESIDEVKRVIDR